jgi:hypothetical protein
MASFGVVGLGKCARVNEFAGSSLENKIRLTEGGRKIVDQVAKIDDRIQLYCEWKTYGELAALKLLRDAGAVDVLTLDDGNIFYAIIDEIDANPPAKIETYDPEFKFFCTLNFIQV